MQQTERGCLEKDNMINNYTKENDKTRKRKKNKTKIKRG